ncbi:MAG: tetratricopeptide repeat protein [Pyrinomonadaceae bacterium]|nr:tetratricopeptide repeat protein [Pyrinomonadaceae bacterium]
MHFFETLKSEIKLIAVVSVAAIAVFANSLGGGFVYDDKRQIVQNPLIQQSELYGRAITSDVWAFKGSETIAGSNYWRPTFTAWSIVNFRLFGLSPFGWHLTNVLLHAFDSVLAVLFMLRLGVPRLPAFFIGLIFAVHPVHTESVAWISGSPDLLMAAALLGSFLVFLSGDGRSHLRRVVSAGLFLLALGAKETAVAALPIYFLPGYLAAGDEENGKGRSFSGTLIEMAPVAVAALAYLALRQRVIGTFAMAVEDSASPFAAVLTAPAAVLFYLRQSIFPLWLGPNYPLRPVEQFDGAVFAAPLMLLLSIALVVYLIVRQHRIALVGAAIFVFLLGPALYISAFPREQIVHDRYLYLPVLGFLVVAYYGLKEVATRVKLSDRVYRYAATAVAIVLALQTFSYNRVWASDVSLWRHSVTVDPNSSSNWLQLAAESSGVLPPETVVEAYDRSLAIKRQPLALMGRGRTLVTLGRTEEAIRDLTEVVSLPPEQINAYTLFQAYEALGIALQTSGRTGEAIARLEEARRRLPIYNAAVTEKLAVVLYLQGKKDAALAELEHARAAAAAEMLPASKLVFFRLGILYAETGKVRESAEPFRAFLAATENTIDPEIQQYRRIAAEGVRKAAAER